MNFRIQIARPQKKIIGQFQYDEAKILGKGTNSVVYQGINLINGEKVSVKQIIVKNTNVQRAITNQVEILQKLKHSNIIKYLHHMFIGSLAYIITQLCDQSLSSKITKYGKIRQEQAIFLFLQIIQGYQQIRKHNYLHRDLKPDNILIKKGKIKIIDFGCALKSKKQVTVQRINIGTPLYMSPQTLQSNIYSQKSQIWTLGVILYEMLSGCFLFKSKKQSDLYQQMKNPIKKIDCSQRIWSIICSCLQYQASNRLNLFNLYQHIKLVIFQIKYAQKKIQSIQDQIQSTMYFDNQSNYIKFLQYIQKLIEVACAGQDHERLKYLIQYSIRMRLNLLDNQMIPRQINQNAQEILKQKVSSLRKNHCFQLQFPSQISQNDRLMFFRDSAAKFKQSLQWQLQAELKQIIKRLYSPLKDIIREQEIRRKQDNIKLLDFLLTAFLLNKILIQCENNRQTFQSKGCLKIILTRPTRVNLQVFNAIKHKMIQLKMI